MSALFHNDFDRLLKERMQSHGGVDVEKFRESAGKIREAELAKGRERSARYRAAHPELANEYNREAQRKYRETHKEAIAGRMKRYRESHKEEIAERFRQWYHENREACLEQQAKWREENRDRIREYQRKYREANLEKVSEKNRKYRESHKEEQRAYQREWYLKNREKVLAKRKAKGDMKQHLGGHKMTDAEIIDELKREPAAELRRLQKQPYKWKVEHALDVIREFVEHEGENGVYVSFSGGKDSLVLLHLVRSIYPDVPAVFANTGIEFPEQVKFVRSFPNLTEVHPIKHFPKIIKENGIVYPSKEVAMYIRDANKGCRYAVNGLRGLDIEGKENRYKARFKKWAYLMDCGVKISPDCCELMKERPLRDYEKMNGKSPIIGTRAEESFRRAVGWMKSGCNSFNGKRYKSTPLALWLESDVMRYIGDNGITLSPMYTDGGMRRTGCMFCPVPIAHGDNKNIEYARSHHTKLYETIMIKLGLEAMLEKAKGDMKNAED